jgi:hypothetical protein
MIGSHVYQYLWRDYNLPWHRGWVLTLTNDQSIMFLALVTTLLAYTQSRAWHISRNIFSRLTEPKVQLPDKDEQIHLSQGNAIRILFRSLRREKHTPTDTIRKISPWIGVVATVNILLFLILGVVLPWTLSSQSSVVLSNGKDACVGYYDSQSISNSELAEALYMNCWYNLTGGSIAPACGNEKGMLVDRPKLYISRAAGCPFPGDVCQNGVESVQLEHSNLSLRQFGIHSRSKVQMSHRLTCAPLNLEPFLNVSSSLDTATVSFCDPNHPSFPSLPYHGTQISSANGPNSFTDQLSGHLAANAELPSDLKVWPNDISSFGFKARAYEEKTHPSLRRQDGTTFIVGLRAGRSQYGYPIDDPLFSAHQAYRGDTYYPDYELTALGCVEQFQLCDEQIPSKCTPWESDLDNSTSYPAISVNTENDESTFAMLLFYITLVSEASVRHYLSEDRGTAVMLSYPLTQRWKTSVTYIDAKEQWILELKAWFETAFIKARYLEINIRGHPGAIIAKPEGWIGEGDLDRFCEQMLFTDVNYNNVDFIQFLIITSCLIVLCLLSISKTIAHVATKLSKFYQDLVGRVSPPCGNPLTKVVN